MKMKVRMKIEKGGCEGLINCIVGLRSGAVNERLSMCVWLGGC